LKLVCQFRICFRVRYHVRLVNEQQRLLPGTLWPLAVAATARALAVAALQPIETTQTVVEEEGISFLVRVLAGRGAREAILEKQVSATIDTSPATSEPASVEPVLDPFLPYDPDMFVADISPTHVCLLNKFNVIDHHLLVVTRAFEEQDSAITTADFAALWACMAEVEGLAFYNAGRLGGASQRHKHLQVAPLPWRPGRRQLPVEDALAVDQLGEEPQLRAWPYVHAALRLDPAWLADPEAAGARLARCYAALLAAFDIRVEGDSGVLPAYNLLATPRWMALIPRRQEEYEGIAVNALGFAGSLLVRSEGQLAYLAKIGPLAVLRAVGGESRFT
jgi:sulfate adenylyltransferase (ADP) / ATP adenylyltransferase